MKSNTVLFVGLAVAVLAGFSALDYLKSPQYISSLLWIVAFAVLGGLFFFAYLVNGLRAWRWLFPSCIFAALSEIIFVVQVDTIDDLWAFVFGASALVIPTLVKYLSGQSHRIHISLTASSAMQQAS